MVEKTIDKYRGCMLGGAVGDALGYAIEFMDEDEIRENYGPSGITGYSLNKEGVAEISDDTQMSLYTANGLLIGTTRGMTRGIMGPYTLYIELCYKDWLKTQMADFTGYKEPEWSWLNNIPAMNHRRAPGQTCINYLAKDDLGSIEEPRNNSKGCGGVMRVAPIGLYLGGGNADKKEVDMIGAEAAALTHGHELGYIPAAVLVHIVNVVSHSEAPLLQAVNEAKTAIADEFSDAEHISYMVELIDKATKLSQEYMDDSDAIHELGEGWVAEETLAIAIYCSLKYENDFEKAVVAAVNHRGDSDSTGAVAGNILGAYLGASRIPDKFIEHLELKETITEIADDLYNNCQMFEDDDDWDELWDAKYIHHTYTGTKL